MSRFFVGQRVRILWSFGWPELAGCEGVIIRHITSLDVCKTPAEWVVAPNCWGTSVAPRKSLNGALEFAPISAQLEPITNCYDKSAWADCVWTPEHLRTTHA